MNNSKGRMFSSAQRKAFAIALCIVLLFSSGFFFGTITSPKAAEDTAVNATEAPQTTQATTAPQV